MMAEAVFDYNVRVNGWPVTTMEFNWNYHPVYKVLIEKVPTTDETREQFLFLNISIFLTGVTDYSLAKINANEAASRLVEAIAFAADISVGGCQFSQGRLDGQRVEGFGRMSYSYNTVIARMAQADLGPQLQAHLAKLNGQAQHRYYSMFHAAMWAQGVGRFLLLYLILLTHFNDSQTEVDKFIKTQNPMVPETLQPQFGKPKKIPVMETVYTRLRNEVGHVRPNTSPSTTRLEIEQNTQSLITIVKALIRQVQ